MKDKRIEILARTLINYSTDLQPGEHIYIEVKGIDALALGKECIRQATEKGGVPFWFYNDESIMRQFIKSANDTQFKAMAEFHLAMMKKSAAYLGIRGSENPFDLADIPDEKMKAFNTLFYRPVHLEQRVRFTKWCVMRYPNNAMSQLAQMPQEIFEDFYFDVCNVNYPRMSKAMDPLVRLMESADKVRLVGPGDTDLTFSIKDIPVVKCDGTRNIPDGEVYTAPVRESINGVIQYNTPSLHEGTVYEGIRFEFKDGKIVKATCRSNEEKLNKVLDTDENARYVGEFSFGLNPMIKQAMKDTLFDEKIGGSIHLTPGACYDEAPNGNKSNIHWDLVMIQTPEFGGGEIYFDDKLIRKDGKFTDSSLEAGFTPENLRLKE
jgi:aminopeptidase